MTELEKVIAGVEHCLLRSQEKGRCDDCPYWRDDFESACHIYDMMRDALALLRGQDESVTPIESTIEQKKFADRIGLAVSDLWCGACHFNLVGHPKFCPNCGKKVKWG